MFGLGCIGHMTFVVRLLREQHLGQTLNVADYALPGLDVVASSRVWSGLLQLERGGAAMAILNGALALGACLVSRRRPLRPTASA